MMTMMNTYNEKSARVALRLINEILPEKEKEVKRLRKERKKCLDVLSNSEQDKEKITAYI